MAKTENIHFRVSLQEKEDIIKLAESNGFNSVAAYILFLSKNSVTFKEVDVDKEFKLLEQQHQLIQLELDSYKDCNGPLSCKRESKVLYEVLAKMINQLPYAGGVDLLVKVINEGITNKVLQIELE